MILLLFKDNIFRLCKPRNILLWTSNNLFSESNLKDEMIYIEEWGVKNIENHYNSEMYKAPSKEFSSIPMI